MSGNAPSPWSWSDEYRTIDGRSTWSLVAADGYGILSCDGEENSPQGINEPSLGRLIAAAPMLLKELSAANTQMEMAAECIEAGRYDEALLHVWSLSHLRNEAIAAATGETK